MTIEKLAVIGGGAWGTALAQVAANGGRETLLWAMEDDVVTAVNRIHENPV
ncbi:MAG TPA: glycerol-3-phosphate dehydrogenase, partial [Sphingomicrobium sp.]|nr:glycerol-3-phosphate dehydrogenase [Sphingomicrobium sp.]